MSTNNRQRMLAHIGRLAQQRRGEIGIGRAPFAEAAGIGSDSTVKTFEFGKTEPAIPTQYRMESGLGWRHGVILEVLDLAESGQADPSEVDMSYLDGREIPEPASRASDLDDVELLTEVIRRLERYRDALDDPPAAAVVTPAQEQWRMFGLAANRDPSTRKI